MAALLCVSWALGACGGGGVTAREPDLPPTPKSVTRANPGGDAGDPARAALTRLLDEPFGRRRDHWNTLRVLLPDSKNWRRVKIWGHPTRATFRYGDDHYAVSVILYTPSKGADDPDACLAKFMEYAEPVAEAHNLKLVESRLLRTKQAAGDGDRPMLVKLVEGSIQSLLASDDYVGAVAVYDSWPETCLVQGFAVVATDHRDLALKARDRWVAEAAPMLAWHDKVKSTPDPAKVR